MTVAVILCARAGLATARERGRTAPAARAPWTVLAVAIGVGVAALVGLLGNPEKLLRRVYAYVAYRVDDRSEAEDITSETFERALRYRHTFDQRRGDAVAWLLGIARNCVYDALLRPRPEPIDADITTEGNVESDVVAKLTLARALASLSSHDRDLLALRYGSDLSAREIAKLLEMRTNAVEVGLTRARSRLAAALEQASSAEHEPDAAGEVSADLIDALKNV
jgi:RNA polymerase sigma-70 factor (ECF subfamily)